MGHIWPSRWKNVNLQAVFGQLVCARHRSLNFVPIAWQRRKPLRPEPLMRTCPATMLYCGITRAVHPLKPWTQLQSPAFTPVPSISTQDWPPDHFLKSEKDAEQEENHGFVRLWQGR